MTVKTTYVSEGVDSLATGGRGGSEDTEEVVGRRRGLRVARVAGREGALASRAAGDTVRVRADGTDGTAIERGESVRGDSREGRDEGRTSLPGRSGG